MNNNNEKLHPDYVGMTVVIEVGRLVSYLTEPDGYAEATIDGIVPGNVPIVLRNDEGQVGYRLIQAKTSNLEFVLQELSDRVRPL
jgi:hypothetical protein